MSKYKIMTPGPVQVPENVRLARSISTTNADLDPQFYDEYKETCELISKLLHTKNETLILSGEGILGLEAACASMTESGDRVLILDNGIYGAGFADFVSMYGGTAVMYTKDYKNALNRLREALQEEPTELAIDGILHRFEFTFELAWKTIKDYLEYMGISEKTGSPRENIQLGFKHGIISDGELWLSLIHI